MRQRWNIASLIVFPVPMQKHGRETPGRGLNASFVQQGNATVGASDFSALGIKANQRHSQNRKVVSDSSRDYARVAGLSIKPRGVSPWKRS